MLYIDPAECIDCDACVEVCPADAIFAEDQLPTRSSPRISCRRLEALHPGRCRVLRDADVAAATTLCD
jgi:Fe-S-cluster-containing hydrogenase component 2